MGQINTATLQLGSYTTGSIVLGNTGDALAFPAITTLQLLTSGSINQGTGSSLSIGPGGSGTLAGYAAGAVALPSSGNLIGSIGGSFGFVTGGTLLLVDGEALSLSGYVEATDLYLTVAGSVTENGGSLLVASLQGSATSATFNSGNDYIPTLGSFTTSSGFTLIDTTGLTVTGPVTDGVSISLTSMGSLAANGNIVAPNVSLTAITVLGDDDPPGRDLPERRQHRRNDIADAECGCQCNPVRWLDCSRNAEWQFGIGRHPHRQR